EVSSRRPEPNYSHHAIGRTRGGGPWLHSQRSRAESGGKLTAKMGSKYSTANHLGGTIRRRCSNGLLSPTIPYSRQIPHQAVGFIPGSLSWQKGRSVKWTI